MATTVNERMRAFREKMYAAGYRQAQVWIPTKSEGKEAKMERRLFLRRLEALTIGWPKKKLSKFLSDVLKIIKEKIKEEG